MPLAKYAWCDWYNKEYHQDFFPKCTPRKITSGVNDK